jgi:hypothetical protein
MMSDARAGRVISREPESARVVIEQAGFTRGRSAGRRSAPVAYGLELVNDSYEFDAVGVTVGWRFLDVHGRPLARGSIGLGGVPASTTFYIGGLTRVARNADVLRFSTTATFRASLKSRLVLPVAADIHLEQRGLDRLRLTGRLTNGTPRTLSREATIYAVIFDDKGRIIGGGAETVSSAAPVGLQPGQTAAFAIERLSPTPPRRALFAGVSIEP